MSDSTTIFVVENEFARAQTDSTVTVAEVTGATPLNANTDFDAAASDDPNRFYMIEEDTLAIRLTYTGTATVYGGYLINHNLDHFNASPATKGTMRIEGTNNAADFGTGSAPVDTGIVQVNDGLSPMLNRNAFLFTGEKLPTGPPFTPPTPYKYWQVTVENTADKPIYIGELWIGVKQFVVPSPPLGIELFVGDGQFDLTRGAGELDILPVQANDRFFSDFGQSWNYLVREGAIVLPMSTQAIISLRRILNNDFDAATAFVRNYGRRPMIAVPIYNSNINSYAYFVRAGEQPYNLGVTPDRVLAANQINLDQQSLTKPLNFK